jgi:hypothetical protein
MEETVREDSSNSALLGANSCHHNDAVHSYAERGAQEAHHICQWR